MNEFPIGYIVFISKDTDPPEGWQEVVLDGLERSHGWDAEGNIVECKLIERVK